MLEEEKVWMQRQSESIAEKRAVHLIAEDIQLDVRYIVNVVLCIVSPLS